jgi:CHAD domain-containing protein
VKLRNRLYETVQKDSRRIVRCSKKVSPNFEEENIHKLRTTVKRLRALFRWHGIGKGIFDDRFKALYHAAGDIRDGQVLKSELQKLKINVPAFSAWLTDYIEKAKERWDVVYSSNFIDEWQKDMPSHSAFTSSDPRNFYKKTLERFSFSSTVVTDNRIHDIRKAAKDLMYVAQWIEKNDTQKRILHPAIPEIASRAGEYMDEVNAIRLLRNSLHEEKNHANIEAAAALRKMWLKNKRDKKRELLHLIAAFHGANG